MTKILITAPVAKLLAKIIALPNCQIVDLALTECRAKSDKMGLIFEALARNTSVQSLSLEGTSIPRESLPNLVDLLESSRSLKMLTLFSSGLSDSAMTTLASGFKSNKSLIYIDMRQNTFENDGF